MTWILAIIGLILGVAVDDDVGGLWGLVLGIMAGRWWVGRRERQRLEERLSVIEDSLAALRASPAPDDAPPTAAAPPEPIASRALSTPSPDETAASPADDAEEAPPAAMTTPPPAPRDSSADPSSDAPVQEPPPLEALLRPVIDFFRDGNSFVKVGVVVLLVGIGLLVRYAADRDLISIEARLGAAALLGAALIGIGFRLRLKRRTYALVVQGGGIATLYIVVFAAYRIYALLPSALAFALLVAVCAFATFIAVIEDSLTLAMVASGGGFAAPLLASSDSGTYVVLFSYYAILNAGVFGIAFFKAWRPLNLLGFVATFLVGLSWGLSDYTDDNYAGAQFFVILFFAFYVGTSVLYAWRKRSRMRGWVDGTLVFGTPFVAASLQFGLVRDIRYGVALSSLALAASYLGLAVAMFRFAPDILRRMVEAFLALGVVFVTLTIPYALDPSLTGVAWALEGAGLIWVGKVQRRWLPRLAGVLLQLVAAVAFLDPAYADASPFVNAFFMGGLILATSAVTAAYHLRTDKAGWRAKLAHATSYGLLAIGALWWVSVPSIEIYQQLESAGFDGVDRLAALLLWYAATAVAADRLGRVLDYRALRAVAFAHVLPFLPFASAVFGQREHLLHGWGAVSWPVALAAWVVVLWLRDRDRLESRLDRIAHSATLPVSSLLVAMELAWSTDRFIAGGSGWSQGAWGLSLGLALLALLWMKSERHRQRWPFSHWPRAYFRYGAAVSATLLVFFSVVGDVTSAGSAAPLSYLPVLNPQDLSRIFALLVAGFALTLARGEALGANTGRVVTVLYGAWALEALSAGIARSVHHLADVPFRFDSLWRSPVLQTSVSMTWSVAGLVLMAVGSRVGMRLVWIAGAVPLGIVVLKLFLVDLARVGTVARIVSFVGVGVLLLLVGYLAPVPPSQEAPSPEERNDA